MEHLSIRSFSSKIITTELPRPFKVAHGVDEQLREHVVLTLDVSSTRTGRVAFGQGEASPLTFFTGETAAEVAFMIEHHLGPRLVAAGSRTIGASIGDLESAFPGHPAALAAIDMALHDALARLTGVGLDAVLGAEVDTVPVYKAVGIGTVDETASDAQELVARGFGALKVKVGLDVALDVERFKAVREAVGDDVHICADANEGYGAADAVRFARSVADIGIAYLEQPVARRDLDGMIAVRLQGGVRVMADEALHDLRDAVRLLAAGAVDLFGLKLVKTGGIWRARQLADLATAHDVQCVVISPFDSVLGAAANVLFAASLPTPLVPQGLGTTVVATGDDGPQLPFEGGAIVVPRGVGLDLRTPEAVGA